MARHFSFSEIAKAISEAGWGNHHESIGDAQKSLLSQPDKLAATALLEIMRRFDCFMESIAAKSRANSATPVYMPENPGVFPGVKVGDALWYGELESGFWRSVVVGVDDDNHALIVAEGFELDYTKTVNIASEHYSTSLVAAVQRAAKSDVAYLAPRLDFANKALAAVDAGGDLSEFADGYESALEATQ